MMELLSDKELAQLWHREYPQVLLLLFYFHSLLPSLPTPVTPSPRTSIPVSNLDSSSSFSLISL